MADVNALAYLLFNIYIYMTLQHKEYKVNLFAFAYRLFHEDFSSM